MILTNLLLLIVVVFLFYLLSRVIGTRDEDEKEGTRRHAYSLRRPAFRQKGEPQRADGRPVEDIAAPPNRGEADPVASQTPEDSDRAQGDKNPIEEVDSGRGLAYLKNLEPDFDTREFLQGAQRAYALIIEAFAADDGARLAALLTPDVAAGFQTAIETRQKQGLHMETEILDMKTPSLVDVLVAKGVVQISVDFRVKLKSAIKDTQNRIVDGGTEARISQDRWTFERPLRDTQTHWRLAATEQIEEGA